MSKHSACVKRLYRSRRSRVLAGVCGGIGEYLNLDPVIIRLLWIALTFIWGFGVILYIIAALIIPEEPTPEGGEPSSTQTSKTLMTVLGVLALFVGIVGFASTISAFNIVTPCFVFRFTLPSRVLRGAVFLAIIIAGVFIIVKSKRRTIIDRFV